EGTITKWLKKVGDKVQRDEPLFEISTDKVDAEIPAPSSGVLREIKVQEGTTVQVNTVVAVIGGAGAPAAAPAAAPKAAATPAAPPPAREPQPVGVSAPARPAPRPSAPQPSAPAEHVRSSPLVRRIARENNVDLNAISGTGLGGRISKNDILNFIGQHGAGAAAPARPVAPAASPAQPARPAAAQPARAAAPAPAPALTELPGELVPMTPMRKKIAERMVESRRTSAHVHTVFKVDMTRIVKMREKIRKGWEARHGV